MTWARGSYRQAKHGPVYLREFDEPGGGSAVMLVGGVASVIAALVVVVISDSITIAGEHETTVALIGVPVVAALLVLALYRLQQRGGRWRLVQSAYRACGDEPASAAELRELRELRDAVEPLSEDMLDELERAYGQLIHIIVADGIAEEHELERLARTEEALRLPAERIEHGRVQGFLDVYDRAMEDGVLTDEEQASISHIREALEVPQRLVQRELAFAKQLARAHRVRTGELAPIRVGVRLHGSERAYYTTMATDKKRVTNKGRRATTIAPLLSFESRRSGNLFVTDERLLFDAGGQDSLPLARIVEVGVEADTKFLRVHERGGKTYYYDVPQPYMAMTYIERMLEDSAPATSD